MVNQWGRDGSSSSGSARSGGGFLIPALLALVIGAAGGYAGARYFSGVSAADIEARDKKIGELQQTLSEMKFDNQGANTQQNVLRGRVKELEDQLAAATRAKESLRTEVANAVKRAKDQAQAEIDALQKTLDEAGDLNGELGRARKSLKVSELQIIELEDTVREQATRIDALEKAVDSRKGEVTAALAAARKANSTLEAQLADARKKLQTLPGLEDEIATLREQLSNKTADADNAARREIDKLRGDLDARQRQLDEALRAAGDAGRLSSEVQDVKRQLEAARKSLSDRERQLHDGSDDLKKARSALVAKESEIETLRSANEALEKSQSALAKQIEDLKAELVKAAPDPADVSKPADEKPIDDGMTPRDRDAVESAVEDLPGYDNLDETRQERLVTMLERGECVTTSLKAAYGHVPAVALRNLIRELGGRC